MLAVIYLRFQCCSSAYDFWMLFVIIWSG
jgi:hypothetical protein